jgi:hypothetical protein
MSIEVVTINPTFEPYVHETEFQELVKENTKPMFDDFHYTTNFLELERKAIHPSPAHSPITSKLLNE